MGAVVSLSLTHPFDLFNDRLAAYLAPRQPFVPDDYSYDDFWADLISDAAGDVELVRDWLDLQPDIPQTPEERTEGRKKYRKDIWSAYPKLTTRERAQLVQRGTPLIFRAARPIHGAQRQAKAWERKGSYQLLVESYVPGMLPLCILTMARNRYRDQVITLMAVDDIFRLEATTSLSGMSYFKIVRLEEPK